MKTTNYYNCSFLRSPVVGLDTVTDNVVCCTRFRDPKYPNGFVFEAIRLKGAKNPDRVLKPGDLNPQEHRNWRPQIGMVPSKTRQVDN